MMYDFDFRTSGYVSGKPSDVLIFPYIFKYFNKNNGRFLHLDFPTVITLIPFLNFTRLIKFALKKQDNTV